jgi:hypothetical protein
MTEIEAEAMFRFKEFLLVFYGAHWCPESRKVAAHINAL